MRIGKKLTAGFIIVSLLVSFVGLIGLYANSSTIASFESGEGHFDSIVMASVEVSSYAKRAEGHVMLFLTLNDTADADKFSQRIASLRNYTSIIDQKAVNPEARKILEQIKNGTAGLQSVGESLIKAYKNESGTPGGFDFNKHKDEIRNLNKFSSEIRENGVKLAELETQIKAAQDSRTKEMAAAFFSIIFVISAIAFIAALALGYFIAGNISRPIKKLKEVAAEVGRGNLEIEIKTQSKDEIGELTESFKKMVDNLKKSQKEIEDHEKELKKSKQSVESKIEEMERFNRLAVGRELRMIELKKRVKELEEKSDKKKKRGGE